MINLCCWTINLSRHRHRLQSSRPRWRPLLKFQTVAQASCQPPTLLTGSLPLTGGTPSTLSVSNAFVSVSWSTGALPIGIAGLLATALQNALTTTITTAGGVNSVAFTFSAGDHNFDMLADQETLLIVYNVTVANGTATTTQPLTITVNGSNDAPTITGTQVSADRTETDGTLSATGTLSVVDVDLSDTVTVTVDSVSVGGTFAGTNPLSNGDLQAMMAVSPATALNANPAAGDNFTWTFTSDASGDSAFNFLAQGETLVLTYTLEATDSVAAASTDTQDVTVTITGSNDAPVITEHTNGAVTRVNDSVVNLTDTGTLFFTDVDLSDAHVASVAFVSSTFGPQMGSLTAGPAVTTDTTGSGIGGVVNWDFSAANSAVHALAFGQTVTETYKITINDGANGSATENIDVTITNNEPLNIVLIGDTGVAEGDAASYPSLDLSNTLAPGIKGDR